LTDDYRKFRADMVIRRKKLPVKKRKTVKLHDQETKEMVYN